MAAGYERNIALDTRDLGCRLQEWFRERDRKADQVAPQPNRERRGLFVAAARKQEVDGIICLALDQTRDGQPEAVDEALRVHAAAATRNHLELGQFTRRIEEFDLYGAAEEHTAQGLTRDTLAVDVHDTVESGHGWFEAFDLQVAPGADDASAERKLAPVSYRHHEIEFECRIAGHPDSPQMTAEHFRDRATLRVVVKRLQRTGGI